jgi:DNA gyrase subunit A
MNAITPTAPERRTIEEEMKRSYLEYAMSVIVSRALPDVRDGLKPVHRRILYAMKENGYDYNKPYRKSARIVGDVMGKYHPHGDAAIYDTMVRLAQNFSVRVPLIDGQGNFGSVDGDPPAAMRYTEARLSRAAHDMLEDIDEGTVDFVPNYDSSTVQPVVLPTRFPNLLVNGQQGIAVGMATNIPPHNLGEVIDVTLLLMQNPDASTEEIMKVMPGPDLPTGGVIMGRGGIRQAFETGRGSITIAGEAEVVETKKGKQQIVITSLPYQVNKAKFMEDVADMVNEKKIVGITDIRDETDRTCGSHEVRVVVEVHRDADANVVLNQLRRFSALVQSFGVNAVCLDSKGVPRTMGVRQVISEFLAFRKQVIRRRTIHKLDKARELLQRQIGLFAATTKMDEVVRLIRTSPDTDTARQRLRDLEFPTAGEFAQLLLEADPDIEENGGVGEVFKLTEDQIKIILDMRLNQLTGLEQDKIAQKARDLSKEINYYIEILNNEPVLLGIMERELLEVKERHKSPRLTKIETSELDAINDEDLIERKDIVITVTHGGYIKRTPLEAYREQKRGGKGKSGMETKDDDFVVKTLVCTTHTPLIFFTTRGIAHALKAHRLPEAAPNAKGRSIANVLENMRTSEGETVAEVLALPESKDDLQGKAIVFVTDFGDVRRNDAMDFANINRAGKIAIKLEDDMGRSTGKLVNVLLCDTSDDVLLATKKGMSIRFPLDDLRPMQSRTSTGVRGILLEKGDTVISASLLKHFDLTTDERNAFLAGGSVELEEEDEAGNKTSRTVTLTPERFAEIKAAEQFLLTASDGGYGKRSSSHDFRVQSRGGKGIACMNINVTTGSLIAAFPVIEDDGLVMVTDSGQMIRTRVREIRTQGRATRGVTLFKLSDGQKIVDVARIDGGDEEA